MPRQCAKPTLMLLSHQLAQITTAIRRCTILHM